MSTSTTEQRYESWKGTTQAYPTRSSIVPSNSRPSTNGVSENPDDYQSAFGTARPLKIWRKQLIPPKPNSSSSKASGNQLSMPGGSVMVSTAENCPECADSKSVASINTLVFGNNSYLTSKTPNKLYNNSEKYTEGGLNIYDKCISCDPESRVIKSGVTKLDKNYYATRSAYLRARGKTFAQKSTPQKRDGVTYVTSDGKPAYPSDSSTGSQVYNTPNCYTNCGTGKTVTTIYKPSNINYGVQGAVDSGTRMMRLKQNAMNKNGASFDSAYGKAAVNAGKYSTISSPYFIKSKVNICSPNLFHRNGQRNVMCFN